MADPFWQSAKVLLNYKVPLALALTGALVSAGCFGAGIGMVLWALWVLLSEDRSTVAELITEKLIAPDHAPWLQDLGRWLVPHVPQHPYHGFLMVMAIIAMLSVIGSCGRYFHELVTITISQRAALVWRSLIFRRLVRTELVDLLHRGSADHISRVVFDTRPLARAYKAILGKSVEQLLKGVVAIAIACSIDFWLTLIALLGAPPIAILLRRFGKHIRRAAQRAMRQRGRMIGALKETLDGIRVVKVHNAEGYERRRFGRINRALYAEETKTRTVAAMASPLIDLLGLLGVMVVASFAAYRVLGPQQIEPARFMTVLVALAGAANSLRPLANLNNQISEGRAAATRVLEMMTLPAEPTGADAQQHLPALASIGRSIGFQEVTFAYPGAAHPAINQVTLHVEHGQTIAIVGGNGSGKTTLLSLLPRLLEPQSGQVLIDGVDIATVSLRSLRRQIAVVTQQSMLFEGTIAENISYGQRHRSLRAIVDAAQVAMADDFIRELPDGYQARLGELGEGLSGGQRQRVCLARAILIDPRIFIFDEATSQIDTDSEAKINEALHKLRMGRTVFIIAHRLSTVVDADRIVVMDSGRIIDQGKHVELLERCPDYRTLIHTQLQNTAPITR